MYSPALLDHFQNPRNAGELPPPALTVEVTNPACGDIMRLSFAVEEAQAGDFRKDSRFKDVRFKTRGCVAAIACGSLLTELIQGKSLDEAGRISAADIASALGGLPPESGHAAVLAQDALKAALKAAK